MSNLSAPVLVPFKKKTFIPSGISLDWTLNMPLPPSTLNLKNDLGQDLTWAVSDHYSRVLPLPMGRQFIVYGGGWCETLEGENQMGHSHAPFQTFLGNINAYELWDESHKFEGLSLLWASGVDEWLFRPIGKRSAGLWFPFCVRFGWAPKWQARTTYHDRVWSHAFPMLSHTKQWGLPQLTLSPLQLPPPVHVLALCHYTKPPFSSSRFLHIIIKWGHCVLGSSFLLVHLPFVIFLLPVFFPVSSVQWFCAES